MARKYIMDSQAVVRMNQDQFLLKWNNHQNNFVEVFSYLRTQDAFVDVTLACDGKSFSAHRVVLSACSPYFQTLFQTNPCKHPIVFLKDVKGQELEALIEFIYKGEVSVSQSELASLISTAENLKIKGLAEPDRPTEKNVKRIASPPRPQPLPLPPQSSPATTVGVPQHLQVSKYPQSSPVAKRKKSEQFNVQSSYVGMRENQEEVVTVEAGNGENLSLRGENLSLRGENLSIRDHSAPQVVLVPSHEPPHQTDISSHTPQPYASHHGPIAASEGVLYSVSGTAIYAGTAQVSSSSRGEQLTREVYPQTDQYHSSDEGTLPGPSGVQTQQHAETSMDMLGRRTGSSSTGRHELTSSMVMSTKCDDTCSLSIPQTIKLEPSSGGVPTETWEGSNQSYEDGGGGIGGSGSGSGVVPTTGDPLTMQLPLHTEMTESSQMHDSSRGSCVSSGARCHDMSAYTSGGEGVGGGGNGGGESSGGIRRLLECEHCHKHFTSRFNLQRHQLIHTGAKPYECPLCHQRFNQSGHVKTHLRTRHPTQEAQTLAELAKL
ncbi:protein bric-a-brac 1 isoform X6 [Procambarus clarkii]|uniref:protein bric-a-brac 1 isoform X6 n=1 Tax=Procambarus clarkii TaxID=6728 RepID=UPI003743B588